MLRRTTLPFRATLIVLSFLLAVSTPLTYARAQWVEGPDPSSFRRSRIWVLPATEEAGSQNESLTLSSAITGTTHYGQPRVGRILGRNGSNIVFLNEATQSEEEVAIHRITRTQVESTGSYIIPGVFIGAVAGGVIGAQMARADDVEDCLLYCDLAREMADTEAKVIGAVVGTLIGASVGSILGSLIEYDSWKSVETFYGFLGPASAGVPSNSNLGLALRTHFD